MIRYSTFTSTFDNVPEPHTAPSWAAFADYLEAQSRIYGHPSRKGRTPCVCPAVYREPLRRKANVSAWDWFAADIDNKSGNQPDSDMLACVEKCEALGLPFVLYTTTSSADHAQCFRLMFPLSRSVAAGEFASVWGSIATWLGCVDRQTKDESRLFVAPRKWDGADNHFFRFDDGVALDVDAMLWQYPVAAAHAPRRAAKGTFALPPGLKPLPAPLGLYSDLVTTPALTRAQTGEKGGRMFAFMVSVATRGLLKGYEITVDDLVGLGGELAATMNRQTHDIVHDATNALARAVDVYGERKAADFEKIAPAVPSRWLKRAANPNDPTSINQSGEL